MPTVEDCKRSVEITVPTDQVQAETERVVSNFQKHAKIPGFRPGKVPANIIRSKFAQEIRQEVVEQLLPKAFRARAEQEQLQVVGNPNVTEVHYHEGEPLKFKAEFEVAPQFELGEYRGLTVPYTEPQVSDEDVEKRIEELRIRKADFVNEDPRPLADGDFAVVSLRSIAGVEGEPIENDDMMLHIGDPETMPEFSEHLRGVSPGEEREIDVKYPDDYAQERIAGKTVRFAVNVKGVRRRELPEVNDEFAQDLGDFKDLAELRDALRKNILAEKEFAAQREAKDKLVERLVDAHHFPVPETYIDRQIEFSLEQTFRQVTGRSVDVRRLNLDWAKLKESRREKATRDVQSSLLLDKVADRENLYATQEEVDRELQRMAKSQREPVAALRLKLEKDGTLARIANHIRTEKTLNFLFENARKVSE